MQTIKEHTTRYDSSAFSDTSGYRRSYRIQQLSLIGATQTGPVCTDCWLERSAAGSCGC